MYLVFWNSVLTMEIIFYFSYLPQLTNGIFDGRVAAFTVGLNAPLAVKQPRVIMTNEDDDDKTADSGPKANVVPVTIDPNLNTYEEPTSSNTENSSPQSQVMTRSQVVSSPDKSLNLVGSPVSKMIIPTEKVKYSSSYLSRKLYIISPHQLLVIVFIAIKK